MLLRDLRAFNRQDDRFRLGRQASHGVSLFTERALVLSGDFILQRPRDSSSNAAPGAQEQGRAATTGLEVAPESFSGHSSRRPGLTRGVYPFCFLLRLHGWNGSATKGAGRTRKTKEVAKWSGITWVGSIARRASSPGRRSSRLGRYCMGGWHGDSIGVLVSAFALVNFVTSLTGFCPGYIPFGVSTLAGGRDGAETAVQPATLGTPPVEEVRFGLPRAGAAGLPLA
jgi:hypothetical protein